MTLYHVVHGYPVVKIRQEREGARYEEIWLWATPSREKPDWFMVLVGKIGANLDKMEILDTYPATDEWEDITRGLGDVLAENLPDEP